MGWNYLSIPKLHRLYRWSLGMGKWFPTFYELKWSFIHAGVYFNPTLQCRHNERDGVSNHQPHACLLNVLFGRRSKKTSKLRVTGFCTGNSPVTSEFPTQRASHVENVSIWWRHHEASKKSPWTKVVKGWIVLGNRSCILASVKYLLSHTSAHIFIFPMKQSSLLITRQMIVKIHPKDYPHFARDDNVWDVVCEFKLWVPGYGCQCSMMTSSNGDILRVTGPLCGEFTGPGEFPTQRPVTRGFDVFFDLRLNKRLSKQSWGWWFETLSSSLWRHRNDDILCMQDRVILECVISKLGCIKLQQVIFKYISKRIWENVVHCKFGFVT